MANSFVKSIPSMITGMNLFCGSVSIIFAVEGDYALAAWCIVAASVFDFFDGLAARGLKAVSEFGKQFDSLSDLVSFGVAPAFILYEILKSSFIIDELNVFETDLTTLLILFSPVVLIICSAVRLGIFNTDTRQKKEFRGIPTPANAILVASLPLILTYQPSLTAMFIIINFYVLPVSIIIISALMLIPFRVISLKFENLSLSKNIFRYILILISITLIILKGFIAIPLIYISYVVISIVQSIVCKSPKA